MQERRRSIPLISVCILLLATPLVTAQEESEDAGLWQRFLEWREARIESTESYMVNAQGIGYAALQDTRMTPLVYHALGGSLWFQSRAFRPKESVFHGFFFQYSMPLTEGTVAGDYSYANPRGTWHGSYLRQIPGVPLRVGGGLSATGNLRVLDALSNSSLNYDIVLCAETAARYTGEFTLFDRPADWHAALAVPVVSWVARHPRYNVSLGGSETGWAPPWKLYRLRLNLGLSRLMNHSDENRLTLDYHYDFYGMRDRDLGTNLALGIHTVTFGRALKTK